MLKAVKSGNADCVKLLLEKGARTEAIDIDNETPLHDAVSFLVLSSK